MENCKKLLEEEKPVEESEIQEGGKKKMHTSADDAEVKLGFAETQCPSHIYVGFTRYAVFPFNAPPCRCYSCQGLGHVAVNCNSPLRCLVCSGLALPNQDRRNVQTAIRPI
ncbi:Zinc finger CCHC-type [Trinorchestia longiramus]|nr:Zinc finger CCHC-type [Trinorchestia longiramus]